MNIVLPRTSVVKQLTEDGMLPAPRLSPSRSHSPISEMGKARSPARGRQVRHNFYWVAPLLCAYQMDFST